MGGSPGGFRRTLQAAFLTTGGTTGGAMAMYDNNMLQSVRPPSRAPWVLLVATMAGAAGGGYWLYGEREHARAAEKVALASEKGAKEAEEGTRKSLTEQVEKLESEKTELAAAKAEMAK